MTPRLTRERFDAVVFDMDGVITDTTEAHAGAWAKLFEAALARHAPGAAPFDAAAYLEHVDGKRREDGVRAFLASRGVVLPEGTAADGPEAETVHGLALRKNGYFQAWLGENRVRAFPDCVALIRGLQAEDLPCALISSSRNAKPVLQSAGALDLFDAQVDGVEAARLGLPGKPDPAVFLEAARRLGSTPERTAVVEDALSGVEAGARGGFALVVGVDRTPAGSGHAEALAARGAHLVTRDLATLAP